MLRLPKFKYYAPKTIQEAITILGDYGPETMVVAGGTDLFPNMKRRQFEPKVVVGLRGVNELNRMSGGPAEGITLGACLTLSKLARDPDLLASYQALARACASVAIPQIRNMGTIGGNLCLDTRCNYYDQTFFWRESLGFCMKKDGDVCPVAPGGTRCWAVSSTDSAPVMIALDGKFRLVGPRGERVVAARDFYRDDGINYIAKAPDEVLVEIVLPSADGRRSTYAKLRRRDAFDFPVLGVAVAVKEEAGVCLDARIVLGGVGSRPVEMAEAVSILIGNKLTKERIEAAAQAVYGAIKPLDNTDYLHVYRKKMAPVFTRRVLEEVCFSGAFGPA
jgi:4-hydroxybenzoyl-CoA reductase subunit beta